MSPYENAHSRLADRYEQDADALAAQANYWIGHHAAMQAAKVAAEEAFGQTFDRERAIALAQAQDHVLNVARAVEAVANAGGPAVIRENALTTDPVFGTLAKGFAEKVEALTKLIAPALKVQGQRRAELTEAGLHPGLIERDPVVQMWGAYKAAIDAAIAVATFGQTYSSKRGVGYALKTFDALYSELTAPFPAKPAMSVPTA